MSSSSPEVSARIARLFVYPIKSCAGIELAQAQLTETGFDLDRAWMVVDGEGVFMSQRQQPRMALIRPQIKHSEVVLRAPGMLALHLKIDTVEAPATVRIWDDVVPAFDMGDLAAQWFSDFLGCKARLVRFDPEHRRLSSRKWTHDIEAPNQFADGYPLLLVSEASLAGLNERLAKAGHAAVGIERFRPNIVLAGLEAHDEDRLDVIRIETVEGQVLLRPVKPCARCPIPNIDPATAQSSPGVTDTLQGYRKSDILDGAVTFAMNLIILEGDDLTLEVGQLVTSTWRFD